MTERDTTTVSNLFVFEQEIDYKIGNNHTLCMFLYDDALREKNTEIKIEINYQNDIEINAYSYKTVSYKKYNIKKVNVDIINKELSLKPPNLDDLQSKFLIVNSNHIRFYCATQKKDIFLVDIKVSYKNVKAKVFSL
jgi:hypothetical protein